MNRVVLFVFAILLGACSSRIKVPQFDFTLENCYEISGDPNHEYHTHEFVVTGCNVLIEGEKERDMWGRD